MAAHIHFTDPDLDRLFEPARFYRHPQDVISDESLSIREKRAILSSWASDACAVDSSPQLRWPRGAPTPITFDDIMDALKTLDTVRSAATSDTNRERGAAKEANRS